jgi:hypothetical protein
VVNLEALAKNGGHYRVRIPSSQGNFVMASVPACQVLASRFVDQITVHMTSSKPIGISYYTSSSECTQKINSETGAWSTRPRIKHGEEGPRPNLDPLGTGRAAGSPSAPAPQAPQEEPGFFGKYVRFVVRLFPSLVLSSEQYIDTFALISVALSSPNPDHAHAHWYLRWQRRRGRTQGQGCYSRGCQVITHI